MSKRFIPYHGVQMLLGKFHDILKNHPNFEHFGALVGFLRTSGYFGIRHHLDKVLHILMLVGIEIDASMAD